MARSKKSKKRKKPRSAAQKAATRKLVALNKKPKRSKRTSSSTKRRRSSTTSMKKKSSRKTQAKGLLSRVGISKSTGDKVLKGAGAAALATAAVSVVAPQFANNPILRVGAAYLADNSIEGVIGSIASNPRTLMTIRNAITSQVGGMGMSSGNMVGFA